MSKPDLHIVSFAVPYPATYGGAIDAYNRLKALSREGIHVCLHCFIYGSFNPHDALKEVADEVHYYPRIAWPALLAPGFPYIVASRRNPKLLQCLNEDDAPVLFEGIHTTGFIDDLHNRKKFLRSHNIEYQYYRQLAGDSSRFNYLFFQRESLALERYETKYANAFDKVFCISPYDHSWYQEHTSNSECIPVFHGFNKTDIKTGRGDYLLYQGDLSIQSNQKAVLDILKSPGMSSYPFIIAGKKGDRSFEEKLTKYPNVSRVADVSEETMTSLVRDAQIIVIHSRHSSGMKVKLFTAVYNGRFIFANENSLTRTPLDRALHVYHSEEEIGPLIQTIWPLEFTEEMIAEREAVLKGLPDDQEKAKMIVRSL